MRDQISSGNMPELVVLDRATRDYNTRERELIAQARRQNEFILNRK